MIVFQLFTFHLQGGSPSNSTTVGTVDRCVSHPDQHINLLVCSRCRSQLPHHDPWDVVSITPTNEDGRFT
jgi:hypothetical protein